MANTKYGNISLQEYNANNRKLEHQRLERQKNGEINQRMFYSALWDDNVHYAIEYLHFEKKTSQNQSFTSIFVDYLMNFRYH